MNIYAGGYAADRTCTCLRTAFRMIVLRTEVRSGFLYKYFHTQTDASHNLIDRSFTSIKDWSQIIAKTWRRIRKSSFSKLAKVIDEH